MTQSPSIPNLLSVLDDKVVISKAGKPYPDVDTQQARKPGRLKGVIQMSEDFDSTPEDIIEGFEGKL